jgi:hypothetical protein
MVYLNHLKKLTQKRGYNLACTGKNQMGKSNTALKIAQHFNRDKHLDSYLAFDSIECRGLIDNATEGMCIIFDDADVAFGSRNWRFSTSQAVNEVLATCGFKRLLIIFTLRDLKNLDSFARRLIDEELYHYDVGKTTCYTYRSDWGYPRSMVKFPCLKEAYPALWRDYMEKKQVAIKKLGEGRILEDKIFRKIYLEGKSEREVVAELKKEGFEASRGTIYRFKKKYSKT